MERTTTSQLANQIENAIIQNPHFNHRKMRLQMKRGHVVLRGEVASYFEKQMAQEALMVLDGVETIQNQLQVQSVN